MTLAIGLPSRKRAGRAVATVCRGRSSGNLEELLGKARKFASLLGRTVEGYLLQARAGWDVVNRGTNSGTSEHLTPDHFSSAQLSAQSKRFALRYRWALILPSQFINLSSLDNSQIVPIPL